MINEILTDAVKLLDQKRKEKHELQLMHNSLRLGGVVYMTIGKFKNHASDVLLAASVEVGNPPDWRLMETIETRINDLYREIWALKPVVVAQGLRPILRWSKEDDGETEIVWVQA